MVGNNRKTPKLSPMADDAITRSGIGSLVSLVYICGVGVCGCVFEGVWGCVIFRSLVACFDLVIHIYHPFALCSYYTCSEKRKESVMLSLNL